jgi:hypothetical protein
VDRIGLGAALVPRSSPFRGKQRCVTRRRALPKSDEKNVLPRHRWQVRLTLRRSTEQSSSLVEDDGVACTQHWNDTTLPSRQMSVTISSFGMNHPGKARNQRFPAS